MSSDWITEAKQSTHGVAVARNDIASIISQHGYQQKIASKAITVATVVNCLEQFQDCVRYLNTRRSKGAIIDLNDENDVQDVVYLMLRPVILDLIPENPTDKVASRYVIKDFLSKELCLVIEAKFVRDRRHGRNITKELHDDIETYRNHPHCSNIIFFVYDRDGLIPDVRALKLQVEAKRNYDGKQLNVFCIVKP